MSKFEWRDHFGCIIIFLILLIIGIATACLGGKNNEMVSYVGFAGTIVSIILSTLAIIYAFYQSFASGTFMGNLQEATRKIEQATISFNSVQSDLQNTFNRLDSGICDVQTSVTELKNQSQYMNTTALVKTDKPTTDILKGFIDRSSLNGLFALLICIMQSAKPKNLSLIQILEQLKSKKMKPDLQYLVAYIVSMYAIGFINHNRNETPYQVV